MAPLITERVGVKCLHLIIGSLKISVLFEFFVISNPLKKKPLTQNFGLYLLRTIL